MGFVPIKRVEGSFDAFDQQGETFCCRYTLTGPLSSDWCKAFSNQAEREQAMHSNTITLEPEKPAVIFEASERNIENAVRKIDKSIAHANAEVERLSRQALEAQEQNQVGQKAKDVTLKQIKEKFRDL
jgi:hypothetical protein